MQEHQVKGQVGSRLLLTPGEGSCRNIKVKSQAFANTR